MLAVTLLDNVSGLRAKDFRNKELQFGGIDLQAAAYLLDDNFVVLQKHWRQLILLSRREIGGLGGKKSVLTWIGLYRAVPKKYDKRSGLYCGAGLWLLDTVASGEAVLSFLGRELDSLYSSMEEKRIPSEWRVEDVKLSAGRPEVDQVISSEKPLSPARGISADRNKGTCFLGSASSETLGASIAQAQEGTGFGRFSRVFITDDLYIVDDLRRRGRAVECNKIADSNAFSLQDDGIAINDGLLDIDVVRSLRKEVTALRGIIGDAAGRTERQVREVRNCVLILLILSFGIVFETTSAFIPTILGDSAVRGIVRPLDHASPSVELSSAQTHPVVLAEPGVQPGGSRVGGCLDVPTEGAVVPKGQPAPDNSSFDGANSKVGECLAKSFEELSNFIDKVVPTIQKNAPLKKALGEARESARRVLEVVNPK
jgi:hypothetical protein